MCGCGCSGTNPACSIASKVMTQPPFNALVSDQFIPFFESQFGGAYKPAGLLSSFADIQPPAFPMPQSALELSRGPGTWTMYKPAGYAKPAGAETAPALAPAGFTQAQWDDLTADQKTAYVNADIKTQQDVRNMIQSGLKTAADLILAGIKAGDADAVRQQQLELARIQSAENIERERIRANAQINTPVLQTVAPQAVTTPDSGSSTGTLVVIGAAVAVGYAVTKKKGGKGKRR